MSMEPNAPDMASILYRTIGVLFVENQMVLAENAELKQAAEAAKAEAPTEPEAPKE